MRFSNALEKSEELHGKNISARMLFNRILREKNQVTEMLLSLNELEKYPEELKIREDSGEKGRNQEIEKEEEILKTASEKERFYINLIDKALEFSTEQDVVRDEPNPMVLNEWLKRNRPRLLNEEKEGDMENSTGINNQLINPSNDSLDGSSRKRKQPDENYKEGMDRIDEDGDSHVSKRPFVGSS